MIMKWLSENSRVIIGCLLITLIIIGIMLLSTCDDDAQRQAQQTNRSGAAINAAASEAVTMIGSRVATERTIEAVTEQTQRDIRAADDPDAIRRAVIDGVCKQASHRNDPACKDATR